MNDKAFLNIKEILCTNYRSIKLMSHAMKAREKIIEKRLCGIIEIWTCQY